VRLVSEGLGCGRDKDERKVWKNNYLMTARVILEDKSPGSETPASFTRTMSLFTVDYGRP
jgi:hypothetical protein